MALSSKVDESTVNIKYIRLYTNTELGKNGTMVSRDSGNFASTVVEGNMMKHVIRTGLGYIDVPGVLAAGTVSASGSITARWGAKSQQLSVEHPLTGSYSLKHNLGHTQYYVFVFPRDKGLVYNEVKNSATAYIYSFDANGNSANLSFDFLIIGNNKEV